MTDPALTAEEWRDVVAVGACPALTHAKTRKAEAAILLYGQPFGFTREDVEALRQAYVVLESLADRIAALLPPPGSPA